MGENPHTEGIPGPDEPDGANESGKDLPEIQLLNYFTYLAGAAIGSDGQDPQDGDIVIEYHPHSGKARRILSPEEFKESLNRHPDPTGTHDEPWRPFSSREDFEFAEFAQDAKLNRKQIDSLIKLIRHCQEGQGPFTMTGYNDLKRALEDASKLLTNVTTP